MIIKIQRLNFIAQDKDFNLLKQCTFNIKKKLFIFPQAAQKG